MGQCFPAPAPHRPEGGHPFSEPRKSRSIDSTPAPQAVATRSVTHEEEQKRLSGVLNTMADSAPPTAVPILKALAPAMLWAVWLLEMAWPYIVQLCLAVRAFYQYLPTDLAAALLGFCLCFFGGVFPTLIAAGEAAKMCGWDRTQEALADLVAEADLAIKVSKKDDSVDADKDGVADVNQLTTQDLIHRKTKLLLTNCNPEKVNHALSGLTTSWIAVVAVLKVKFAQTIALAISVGGLIQKPLMAVVAPTAAHLVPAPYRQWIPVVIGWFAKLVGVTIAWYIQRVLSSVHSGWRGGTLCARSLMAWARKRGCTFLEPEESYIDEIAGGLLAAAGIYWQFMENYNIPFPFNIITLPLQIAEKYLQWHVSS